MRVTSLERHGLVLAAAIISVSSYPGWLAYFIDLDLFLSTAFAGPQSSNKHQTHDRALADASSTFPYHTNVVHFLA